jgi:CRP/FNR family transcriptional regulator, cyclic AMP receptor protein
MARTDLTIEVLRRAALFRDLREADLAALALCCRVRAFRSGETLFREGDPGASMLVVSDGTLLATVKRRDGSDEKLNTMGPGEVVGEMALLDPAPRSATVRALTEGTAYELTSDALDVLRARAPIAHTAIVSAAIRDCTRRLRRLDERIERELAK